VLAPAEALLLGRRDGDAVHQERCRGIVEHRVDAENAHARRLSKYAAGQTEANAVFAGAPLHGEDRSDA